MRNTQNTEKLCPYTHTLSFVLPNYQHELMSEAAPCLILKQEKTFAYVNRFFFKASYFLLFGNNALTFSTAQHPKVWSKLAMQWPSSLTTSTTNTQHFSKPIKDQETTQTHTECNLFSPVEFHQDPSSLPWL